MISLPDWTIQPCKAVMMEISHKLTFTLLSSLSIINNIIISARSLQAITQILGL
jgi:hypothetical protein